MFNANIKVTISRSLDRDAIYRAARQAMQKKIFALQIPRALKKERSSKKGAHAHRENCEYTFLYLPQSVQPLTLALAEPVYRVQRRRRRRCAVSGISVRRILARGGLLKRFVRQTLAGFCVCAQKKNNTCFGLVFLALLLRAASLLMSNKIAARRVQRFVA